MTKGKCLRLIVFIGVRLLLFSQNVRCVIDEYCPQISCLEEKPHLLSTEKVNGALTCDGGGSGGVGCIADQRQACLGLLDSGYFSTCDEPSAGKSDMEYCIEYNKSDFILVYNGEERKKLGIPECQLPTLTFNDKYDPCVPLRNYQELKNYVCELYDYDVAPCHAQSA